MLCSLPPQIRPSGLMSALGHTAAGACRTRQQLQDSSRRMQATQTLTCFSLLAKCQYLLTPGTHLEPWHTPLRPLLTLQSVTAKVGACKGVCQSCLSWRTCQAPDTCSDASPLPLLPVAACSLQSVRRPCTAGRSFSAHCNNLCRLVCSQTGSIHPASMGELTGLDMLDAEAQQMRQYMLKNIALLVSSTDTCACCDN